MSDLKSTDRLLRKMNTALQAWKVGGFSGVGELILSRLKLLGNASMTPSLPGQVNEIEIMLRTLEPVCTSNTMLDIGAHFGGALKPFAVRGWDIYAFEPDAQNRKHLVKTIEDFPNVKLFTLAVSNEDDREVPFFTSDVSTGISGLSDFHPSHRRSDTVKTITLKSVCQNERINHIDFLKIDTEGYDLFVLQGFDWDGHSHPSAILTEFENNKSERLGYTFLDQVAFLSERGYALLISEWHPIVEYGRQHAWKRFVTEPAKVTDPNAWGNIFAVKNELHDPLLQIAAQYGPVE
jgi:FkbM family methyltransferase